MTVAARQALRNFTEAIIPQLLRHRDGRMVRGLASGHHQTRRGHILLLSEKQSVLLRD